MEKNHVSLLFPNKKISLFVNILFYLFTLPTFLHGTSYAAGWLGWATSITGIPGVTTAATTAGKTVVNMFVVPKEDVNTLKIRINDLDLNSVKNFCSDKIVECNERINQIKNQYQHSVKKLDGPINEQKKLAQFWKHQYLQAAVVINQVDSFFEVYHKLSKYFEDLKKKNSQSIGLITQEEKIKLNSQYDYYLDYIQGRRANLGAALYENFTYQGDGGVMSRYRKSANRKLNRENRWGVRSFSAADYTSRIEDLLSNSNEELEQQLDIFKTSYTQTLAIIRSSDAEIWERYQLNEATLYEQLGLTPEGLRPKMTLYMPPLNVSAPKSSAPRPIPPKKPGGYEPLAPSSLDLPKVPYTPPSDQRTRFPSDNQVPIYTMPITSSLSLMSTSVPTEMNSYLFPNNLNSASDRTPIFRSVSTHEEEMPLNNTNYTAQDEEEEYESGSDETDETDESEDEENEDGDDINEQNVVLAPQNSGDDASSF